MPNRAGPLQTRARPGAYLDMGCPGMGRSNVAVTVAGAAVVIAVLITAVALGNRVHRLGRRRAGLGVHVPCVMTVVVMVDHDRFGRR